MIRTPALDFEQLASLPQGARIVAYGPRGARYRGALDSVETMTTEIYSWSSARRPKPVPIKTIPGHVVTLVVSKLPLPEPVPQKIMLGGNGWDFYIDADAGALPSELVLGPEQTETWHFTPNYGTRPVAHRKRELGDVGFRILAVSVAIVVVGLIFAAASAAVGIL